MISVVACIRNLSKCAHSKSSPFDPHVFGKKNPTDVRHTDIVGRTKPATDLCARNDARRNCLVADVAAQIESIRHVDSVHFFVGVRCVEIDAGWRPQND